ncbi:MAG: response regulator transcription factor [Streptosporangiaceae bacterium]
MSRILIAEDEPLVADFVARALAAEGYATAHAADGDQALTMARSGQSDLMLLDLGLPGRDGHQVLAELRRQGSGLPVIVVSASGSRAEIATALRGGADDYLSKPFQLADLIARVRRLRPRSAPA